MITAERQRQIEQEGWTPEHDDEHRRGELARAAACYAQSAAYHARHFTPHYVFGRPSEWPWDLDWWKPSGDPVRNLVKAGALIAAEIDRLTRQTQGGESK